MVKKVKFNEGVLAGLVGREYAFGERVGCELIRSKDNYLVEVGEGRYVLRVYRYRKTATGINARATVGAHHKCRWGRSHIEKL